MAGFAILGLVLTCREAIRFARTRDREHLQGALLLGAVTLCCAALALIHF